MFQRYFKYIYCETNSLRIWIFAMLTHPTTNRRLSLYYRLLASHKLQEIYFALWSKEYFAAVGTCAEFKKRDFNFINLNKVIINMSIVSKVKKNDAFE